MLFKFLIIRKFVFYRIQTFNDLKLIEKLFSIILTSDKIHYVRGVLINTARMGFLKTIIFLLGVYGLYSLENYSQYIERYTLIHH